MKRLCLLLCLAGCFDERLPVRDNSAPDLAGPDLAPSPDLSDPACRRGRDCPSEICATAGSSAALAGVPVGQCVDPAQVAYVDRGAPCKDDGPGTQREPFCEVSAALSRLGGRRFVLVRPSEGYYGPVQAQGVSAIVLGPWFEAAAGSDFTAGPAARIRAVAAGAEATLVVDGLNIGGADSGARCVSTDASLTLRRVQVRLVTGDGVATGPCKQLTLDGCEVRDNTGAGVRIGAETRDHRVVNTAVLDNRDGPGVELGATGVFAFNTVLRNGVNFDRASGVRCPVASAEVASSIVMGNGAPEKTQFSGCRLSQVVAPGDSAVTDPGLLTAPVFLDGTVRLRADAAANAACCIDKGRPDLQVRTDLFGTARPLGGGPDIGAHEAK